MAKSSSNIGLLRKASLWIYVAGIWQLLTVIGFMILVFGMLYMISTMIPIPIEALHSISNSYLLVSTILWITIPITIILGSKFTAHTAASWWTGMRTPQGSP